MGVGRVMFLAASWRSTGDGNFISSKSRMGGSSCWPSTMMWKRSRGSCACSSVCRRTFSGGFHPVSRLREYVMPCVVRPACQNLLNRLSGRTLKSILCMFWLVRAQERPPAILTSHVDFRRQLCLMMSCNHACMRQGSPRVNVYCRRPHMSGRWAADSIRDRKKYWHSRVGAHLCVLHG